MAKVYTPHDRSLPKTLEEPFRTPGMLPVSVIMVSVAEPDSGVPNILPAVGWGWLSRLPLTLGVAVCTKDMNVDYYPRGTHPLLLKAGDFALNIPTEDLRDKITKCGELSRHKDPTIDKFKEAGLTPGPGRNITSPHIVECPINYECKLLGVHDLGSHDLFLGEVLGCFTDGEVTTTELGQGEDGIVMTLDDGRIETVRWQTIATRTFQTSGTEADA